MSPAGDFGVQEVMLGVLQLTLACMAGMGDWIWECRNQVGGWVDFGGAEEPQIWVGGTPGLQPGR